MARKLRVSVGVHTESHALPPSPRSGVMALAADRSRQAQIVNAITERLHVRAWSVYARVCYAVCVRARDRLTTST
jgi:hypothetical protein